MNVKKGVRERSIPLEPSECHKVQDGNLVLCFMVRGIIFYSASIYLSDVMVKFSTSLFWFFTGTRGLCSLLWCSSCENPEEDAWSNRVYLHLLCSISPWQHWGYLWPFFLPYKWPFWGRFLCKIFDINTFWCCFICLCQEEVSWNRLCCRPREEECAVYPSLTLDSTQTLSPNSSLNPIESLWGWKGMKRANFFRISLLLLVNV